jgi:isopentenyl phosphate kinase
MNDLVIIKIGGSVITDKKQGVLKVKMNELDRIVKELGSITSKLIVVHGGGSFGHMLAKLYGVHKGKDYSTPHSASKVADSMLHLNNTVVKCMIENGLAPLSFPPHSMLGLSKKFDKKQEKVFRLALDNGFIPVTFGDIVLSPSKGFQIISGDYLAAELAIMLNAKRLIFGTDVDGVYRSPDNPSHIIPKIGPRTKFLSKTSDVTGGIHYKVKQGLRAAKAGVDTLIVNASKPAIIRNAALGKDVIGTRLMWE